MKELFSNGPMLLIIGSLSGYLMSQGGEKMKKGLLSLKDRFIHSVAIEEENDLYRIINLYVAANWPDKSRSTIARWKKADKDLKPTFTPNISTFAIKYKGKRLLISSDRQKMEKMEWSIGLYFATIKISGLFARKAIAELLQEAMEKYACDRPSGAVGIFTKSGYDGMREINEVYPKPLNSLIYRNNTHKRIKKDVQEFLTNQQWYKDRGIPYKRCYCLYGPPGTGKTSMVLSIALDLRRDVYLIDLDAMQKEEDLTNAVASIPAKGIILLEDVDRILSKPNLKLSISSLLNTLDGPFTKKGMLLFMTTNHIDRIDPAILRDGRIDVKEEIGHAGKREVEAYLRLFYNTAVALPVEIELPMASVQEICIRNKNNVQAAIDEIASIEQCVIVP
jgi:chaperone BCS1